jgi:hypothetical protein
VRSKQEVISQVRVVFPETERGIGVGGLTWHPSHHIKPQKFYLNPPIEPSNISRKFGGPRIGNGRWMA